MSLNAAQKLSLLRSQIWYICWLIVDSGQKKKDTNLNFLLKLVSFSSKQSLQSLVCKSELNHTMKQQQALKKHKIFQFWTIHQEQRWEFAFTVVDSLLQQWWINHMENSTAVQCTQLIQKYFGLISGNYFYNVRSLLSVKLHLVLA